VVWFVWSSRNPWRVVYGISRVGMESGLNKRRKPQKDAFSPPDQFTHSDRLSKQKMTTNVLSATCTANFKWLPKTTKPCNDVHLYECIIRHKGTFANHCFRDYCRSHWWVKMITTGRKFELAQSTRCTFDYSDVARIEIQGSGWMLTPIQKHFH